MNPLAQLVVPLHLGEALGAGRGGHVALLSSADNRHDKGLDSSLSIADNESVKIYYGEADVARAAGIKPQTIQVYRVRGQFPKPDAQTVAGRPLWRESTIRKWLDEREVKVAHTPNA